MSPAEARGRIAERRRIEASFRLFDVPEWARVVPESVEVPALGQLGGHEEEVEALGRDFTTWLAYAQEHLIEQPGRWYHELAADNTPGSRTWPGRPDVYHAAQMELLPSLPLTPCFAVAIRDQDFVPAD